MLTPSTIALLRSRAGRWLMPRPCSAEEMVPLGMPTTLGCTPPAPSGCADERKIGDLSVFDDRRTSAFRSGCRRRAGDLDHLVTTGRSSKLMPSVAPTARNRRRRG
jgi:hypothetical protein